MQLSIVTTMYHSAPYLDEFYERCCGAAKKIADDFEIVFVNDGSPDNSLSVALELHEKDSRVRVIDLSRNFGHHKAMMTGLAHARGDFVFLIDCDLEIKPEVMTSFNERLKNSQADVVFGVQENRQDGPLNRFFSLLFYKVFNLLSSVPLPMNLTTARLMSRRYVAALVAHKEREITIGGLWVITGFKQEPMNVKKSFKGSSKYSLARKVSIVVNAITSFSNRPLMLIFYLGSIISILAGLAALYLIFRRVFFGVYLAGWPSLIVSIWLMGGLMIFCVGIIGVYLSKIFIETKQRPYAIIRHIYEREG